MKNILIALLFLTASLTAQENYARTPVSGTALTATDKLLIRDVSVTSGANQVVAGTLGELVNVPGFWANLPDNTFSIAKTSGLQTALNDKVDDSQLSTTGGANKVLQAGSNADWTTGPFANDNTILSPGGNIIMPDKRGIRFLKRDGTFSGQSIFGWDEHGGAPDIPELLLESKGSNGAGTMAFVAYGGIQIGPNDSGRYPRGMNLVSGNAQNLAGFNMMPSGALQFQNVVHNGTTSLVRQMGIQTHALDTSNTNSIMRIYDNSLMTAAGTPSTPGRGDLTGDVIAEIYKDGIWSPGTAPSFSALTTGGATITQTCSKYKTVQSAKFTLDGNRTLVISGALNGMRGVIYVTQPSSGAARTLALPNGGYLPSGWTAPYADLSTVNGYTDRLEWEYDNSSFVWTVTKGLVATYTATDADAAAYITAVETAKGSVATAGQKAAIDAFVIAEKAASRWTGHKRFFFPIWANAAANAIDMKTLATGTFVNSPTQGAGFVQGNGSTQYFNAGATASALGMTMTDAGATVLMSSNGASTGTVAFGCNSGGGQFTGYLDSNGISFVVGSSTSPVGTITTTDRLGIFSLNRISTTMEIFRRKTSGLTTLSAGTVASSGAVPTVESVYMLATNSIGTPLSHWNGPIGAFVIHSGMNSAAATAFTANLKTLWETCTGLTLP